jgi:hypothetical protein
MLTSYSHTRVNGPVRSADYLLPQSDLHRQASPRLLAAALSGPSKRPTAATPRCRSDGLRSLSPTRGACRLRLGWRVSSGNGISPTQWIAMGFETTMEAF